MQLTDDVDPPSALPRGTRLGEFEVRRVLGIGGFGIVYLAFDHALQREVASTPAFTIRSAPPPPTARRCASQGVTRGRFSARWCPASGWTP